MNFTILGKLKLVPQAVFTVYENRILIIITCTRFGTTSLQLSKANDKQALRIEIPTQTGFIRIKCNTSVIAIFRLPIILFCTL